MAIQWHILALLRFILAFIVLFAHLRHFIPPNDFANRLSELGGFSAVIVFLVISGFSIAHSLNKQSTSFYWRRFIRIFPLYFTGIIVSVIPFWLASTAEISSFDNTLYVRPSILNILGNLSFTQNILFHPLPSNGVVWTLGIEVICYVLAPYFYKLSRSKILLLIGCSSIAFVGYQTLPISWSRDIALVRYGIPLLTLLWAWLLGFIYYFYRHVYGAKLLVPIWGCILLSSSSYYAKDRLYLFTYLFAATIFVFSANIKISSAKLTKFFQYLGEISYPLYLFHSPALLLGYYFLHWQNSITLTLFSLLISAIFYHVVDVPIRRKYGRLY